MSFRVIASTLHSCGRLVILVSRKGLEVGAALELTVLGLELSWISTALGFGEAECGCFECRFDAGGLIDRSRDFISPSVLRLFGVRSSIVQRGIYFCQL